MSANYSIDDSIIFDKVDNMLANYDLEDLMKVKSELLKEGKDTSVIDKAIKERKRRDEIIRKNEIRKIIQERRMRRELMLGLFKGVASGAKSKSDNDLMPWEEDALKKEGYEPHNFEEEELEEDDYYFDDDKE